MALIIWLSKCQPTIETSVFGAEFVAMKHGIETLRGLRYKLRMYQDDAENILNKITANADNNLQRHERGKLGRMHKPSTPNTPFIHGDEVIGELYCKNMVLIPFTIDPWARFGPMLQSFLTTTHHPHQKPWRISHTNNKYHRPNANLMYERASQPPCPLGILTSADI
jgi:hypothetical protein